MITLPQAAETDQVPVKSSDLMELQRRILKAESALREKEEENDMLHQRLQQYESRWLDYEQKMRSMEEVWQKQMRSLQSSLSIAKKSLALDGVDVNSDGSVDQSCCTNGNYTGTEGLENKGPPLGSRLTGREMSASLNIINRLAEEFEQRSQVFIDDAKFLVEVKSGQVEASLDPERELRKLKQTFETWRKDYNLRLRETKVIIHELGSDEIKADKVKKKWWGRLKNARAI